ncbi:hypothetical protein [Kineococcus glutinatus]|uniref:Secreted protein n=1 Tax=Kineococcus glutinatus TaxID=1070872 RepID=A0ABP9HX69_9ACTN
MNINWRRVLWWLLVAFVVYAVYRSPNQAADFVRTVGTALGEVVNSLLAFFDRVLQG